MEPRQGPVVSIRSIIGGMLASLLRLMCIFVAATTVRLWPFAAATNVTGQCMAGVVQQLESRCNTSSPPYEQILSAYRAQCCSRPLRVLAPATLESWITRQANQFEQQVSTAVNVTYSDPSIIPSTVDSQLKGWAEQDLWIVDGASIPPLAYLKALLPLEQKIQDSPDAAWVGYQPLWSNLSVAGGRTIAVPISSDALLLYYRRDTLAALGRDVPSSWDELLQLAEDWNTYAAAVAAKAAAAASDATTTTVPPAPQHALCLSTALDCSTTVWVLSAVLASITQCWGPRTGWALALDESDPMRAVQLLNGSAMEQGLAKLGALAAAGPQGLSCGQPLVRFARGECLITLDLGRGFSVLQQQTAGNASSDADIGIESSRVRGVVGVALPPGSTRVLDRSSGELVPVSEDTCRVPRRGSGGGDRSGRWACAAPMLSYGGTFGVISRRNGAVYQELAFQFVTWLSSLEAQWQGVADAGGGVNTMAAALQPVRGLMLEPASALERFTASVDMGGAGYDLADAQSYLAALQAAFTSPNVALEFGAPGAFALRSHMGAAIHAYLNGVDAKVAADGMLRAWLEEWSRLNFTVSDVQQMLLQATPDSFEVPPRVADQGHGGKLVWAIVVGTVLGVAMLAVLICVALWCYRVGRGESRLRRIEPPGISLQTTLVVTDIQDSTKMWELLHSDVMDVAIYHHHSLARRLILRFRGYESATEGDSFIIAFHTADDAVCFCALFQQGLLQVPWPAELLALEGCKAVWMCKSEPEPKRRRESQQSQQPLEVTRSGEPLSALALQGGNLGPRADTSQVDPSAASAASPQLLSSQHLTAAARTEADASSVTLSIGGSRSPPNALRNKFHVGGSSDLSLTPAPALVSALGSQHAPAGVQSPVATVPSDSSATAAASTQLLGPGVLPRFSRNTTPYILNGAGSSSGLTFGALGASPRQLSFMGRSQSRLGASSMSMGTPAMPLPSMPLSLLPTAAAMAPLERRSTPRGSIGSSYRSVPSTVIATRSHHGGQDLITNLPTSPVTFGGSNGDVHQGAAATAAASTDFASGGGGGRSFRESFRSNPAGGDRGTEATGQRDADSGGDIAPPLTEQNRQDGDGGSAMLKPPTFTGYPEVSDVLPLGSAAFSGPLSEGTTTGGDSGVGDVNGGGAVLQATAHVSRSNSAIKRSISVGGGDGDTVGSASACTGESAIRHLGGRFSATGSTRRTARRSSTDTVEVAPDRTTNNSRHSRSTEMATVSEFNVVLESGGQHFINPRSETNVALQQPGPSWGTHRFPLYGTASHLPTVLMPPSVSLPPTGLTEAEREPAAHGVERHVVVGAAAAATRPLGEGAGVAGTALGPRSFSPRAVVRRSSVTFDLQSAGSGSDEQTVRGGRSGTGASGLTAGAVSSLRTQPHSVYASNGKLDNVTVSSVEQCTHETSSPSSHILPIASQPGPQLPYRRAPSHLGPASMITHPLGDRAGSLRRRSEITAGGGGAAAAGFPEYQLPFNYVAAGGLYSHGCDGMLRPSPLGRGASQSSMYSDPAFRAARGGSHGGGTSDATGIRSSNSRSLRGPSVDGEDVGESVELVAYRGQSSPLLQLFPGGTLSEDEGRSGTIREEAPAAVPTTTNPVVTSGGGGSGSGSGVGGDDGARDVDGSPASPPFCGYTGGRLDEDTGHYGRASNMKRSLVGGAPFMQHQYHPQNPQQQQQQQQQLQPQQQNAHPTFPQHLVSGLGSRMSSSLPTLTTTTAVVGAMGTRTSPVAVNPSTQQPRHHSQQQHSGLSRSLLALVNLPAPRVGSGGDGGGRGLTTPESRAASMACMMRLASQHNLQSVGDSLCSRWKVVEGDEPGALLVFRGLRVRMGMHSGLSDITDLAQLNRTANRMQYTGTGLSMAKAVADCAHGGQVLISQAAFTQLAVERLREGVMVLHMGEHRIKSDLPSISLYCGCPRGLQGRLPALRAVCSLQQFSLGVLDAPAGNVVVVFVHVVGAVSLLEWRPDLAAVALEMFRDYVSLELIKYQGYLVEAVDGLVLASFPSPSAGLAWVSRCQSDMNMLPWPEELMCHEACEELCVTHLNPNTGIHEDIVVFRGLRLKAGVDMGRLRGEINCVTGRMSYRGRAMNRAARIVAAAGSGQILASREAWLAASLQPAARLAGLTGLSMGQFLLKGVAEPVEVYQVKTATAVVSRRARTVLTRPEGPLELDELPISNPIAAWHHHVSINNATSAAAAAAAASAAALTQHISTNNSVPQGISSLTAAGVAGSGSVPSRLILGSMYSMAGGLAAALRREDSVTRRPVSRTLSRRSSRRSSLGSQFSNLAATTMVAVAHGSLDGRQDISNSPSRTAASATAATAVASGVSLGTTHAAMGLNTAAPATAVTGAASIPTTATTTAAAATAALSAPAMTASRSGSSVPVVMGTVAGQRSASQAHLRGEGCLIAEGPVNAGVSSHAGHPVLRSSISGYVSMSLAGGGSGAAAGGACGPYAIPSLGSGTRTSRNSAGDTGCDIDGAHSSNPRSSNPSNRSPQPPCGHRLTASLQLPAQQPSTINSQQHPQQFPQGATTVSPVSIRSGPAQGIVRHLSALIRSASLALQGSSANSSATAAAAGGGSAVTGPKSGSIHPVLPSPAQGRRITPAAVQITLEAPDTATATTIANAGASTAGPGLVEQSRFGDRGLRKSASGAIDLRLRLLSSGGTALSGGDAGGGGGGGGGGLGLGLGLGGLRDRLPARLWAAGGLFRAGSFSGQVRRGGTDDNGRTSDFGLNPTAGVAVNPCGVILGGRTRSPTAGGRRFMSTASGIGYLNFVTANGGAAPGSPSIAHALRGATAAGGSGSFHWRRGAHAAGAVAAAAIASSSRGRELRGDVEMLDRILREGRAGRRRKFESP
ncbi:hypothetical protein Vafri_4714 [Volvox africanus]|uniref:Guanylate cyclase domain-containing protein n=1 Tax=Volvox africanus TaxID=51714 RepID=A0A8J4EU35_9CHLO|nr:hypothetical protein Vafri_4714 [Volvox africanus]